MRIGIFLDEWAQGGIPVFLERIESRLTAQGHHVILFLLRPHGKRDKTARDLYRNLKAKLQDRCVSLDMDAYPKRWRKAHFVERILHSKIDCLLINQFRNAMGYLEAIAESVPLISVSHTDSDYYYHEFLLAERMTAAHIAVSEAIYERCKTFAGPQRLHRIHRIPYGVERSDAYMAEPKGPLSIVYCARLDPLQKRCRDLVPIWEQYCAKGGEGILNIIGTGHSIGYLMAALQGHVQKGRVVFHHHLYAQDVPAEMAKGDILLNISNFEGLPQTVLEGASLGLYPVLSDIESGHREIVQQLELGTLCRLGDSVAFADELLRLENNLLELRGQRALIRQRSLQHYDLEKCALRYAEVMESVRETATREVEVIQHQPSFAERICRALLLAKYRRYYRVGILTR